MLYILFKQVKKWYNVYDILLSVWRCDIAARYKGIN